MDPTCDVFLTHLPKNVSEVVVKNLFSSAGRVMKVKIIDDKRNENQKLCFVGFATMDEALEAVRIADNSDAFGEPIKASISKKCLEGMDNSQNRNSFKSNSSRPQANNVDSPANNRFTNVGRGRGLQTKPISSPPSFKNIDVNINDIKLKLKELIEVEIIELNRIDYIFARPIKSTENSKIELSDLLQKINSSPLSLIPVDYPIVNGFYLAKWDDENYYRAELLEILNNGKFRVTFVDEGTSGDIVSDIKQIPEGILQQYPKQFLKLSLGCSDTEDLKSFIIQESDGKVPKIYWLGEFCNNSVPLVNLFLNEDEVVEKYIQTTKKVVREKFSLKFEDLPIHKSGKNPDLKFIENMFKNQMEFVLQVKDPQSVTLKLKKSLSVLPTPGDICIYEKRSSNNTQLFRCVVIRRQLFSFDVQLIDSGEKISNVNIDNLYTAEEIHKNDAPFSINCELDKAMSNEEAFKKFSNVDVSFTITQYKRNNRYVVTFDIPMEKTFEYEDINIEEFVGKGFTVTVSHVVSPLNFYVQIDRDDYVQALTDIQEKVNINYNGEKFPTLDTLKINQAVVAPFIVSGTDAEFFRAKILEIRKQVPQVHVLFVDYGNDEWVKFESLLNVNIDLIMKPGMAFHCQLNVDIKKETWSHAVELFSQLVGFSDNDITEFAMQVIQTNANKFVVDLVSHMKGSLTIILEKSGTCQIMKDEKIKLSKPMCNGDKNNFGKSNCISDVNSANEIQKVKLQKYSDDELTQKVIELEKRLTALEKLLIQ